MTVNDTEAREMRDMLVRIDTGVQTLVSTSVDHEARIRIVEVAVTTLKTQRIEREQWYAKMIGVGMLLAAAAGVVGSMLGKTF
jgi:hypothetical protein